MSRNGDYGSTFTRKSAQWGVRVQQLDHLVLTVASIERAVAFYTTVLGMEEVRFGAGRTSLAFGTQKINLHLRGEELSPHALRPLPGSADLCLLVDEAADGVMAHLARHDVEVELGPVERTGARGPMTSVYLRDPDANLIELSRYEPSTSS